MWKLRTIEWTSRSSVQLRGFLGQSPVAHFHVAELVRIPLMADIDSTPIADSVPGDGGQLARVS